jgi:hypothetical protein
VVAESLLWYDTKERHNFLFSNNRIHEHCIGIGTAFGYQRRHYSMIDAYMAL